MKFRNLKDLPDNHKEMLNRLVVNQLSWIANAELAEAGEMMPEEIQAGAFRNVSETLGDTFAALAGLLLLNPRDIDRMVTHHQRELLNAMKKGLEEELEDQAKEIPDARSRH